MNEDAEIVAEFLVESHENLDQLDRDLVELEQTPDSRELLSSIFRAIHTIKGTSGFLAFERLERLAHHGEDLLSRLRDGQMQMTTDVAGVLLRMVDTTRALLDSIESTGGDKDAGVPVDDVVVELQAVPAGRQPAPAVEVVEVVQAPAVVVEEPAEPVAAEVVGPLLTRWAAVGIRACTYCS